MKRDDLRPELRHPSAHGAAVAFLELVAWRSRLVADLREITGTPHLTVLDSNVLLHVFTFGMNEGGGSSAAQITDGLGAPRRTIRDSLALLERLGYVVREDGLYYPTPAAAAVFNERFEDRFRLIAKICGAFEDYRRSIGR